jgi:hypothetical protein
VDVARIEEYGCAGMSAEQARLLFLRHRYRIDIDFSPLLSRAPLIIFSQPPRTTILLKYILKMFSFLEPESSTHDLFQ